MVYRKQRVIERYERNGVADMLSPEEIARLNNLDGREVTVRWWDGIIEMPITHCTGKDGNDYEVCDLDCE